jgi:nucleoside-diphosphate-sugar epimerase
MIEIIEDIADIKLKKNYQLDKPKGVRGRSSDNTKIISKINWKPKVNLRSGLEKTYNWIYKEITNGSNVKKFVRNY